MCGIKKDLELPQSGKVRNWEASYYKKFHNMKAIVIQTVDSGIMIDSLTNRSEQNIQEHIPLYRVMYFLTIELRAPLKWNKDRLFTNGVGTFA